VCFSRFASLYDALGLGENGQFFFDILDIAGQTVFQGASPLGC
jgi:hypothetical protein